MNKNLKRTALSMVLTVALMPSVTFASYEEDQKALTAKVVNITNNTKDGKIATFNIVMDGIHPYKGY